MSNGATAVITRRPTVGERVELVHDDPWLKNYCNGPVGAHGTVVEEISGLGAIVLFDGGDYPVWIGLDEMHNVDSPRPTLDDLFDADLRATDALVNAAAAHVTTATLVAFPSPNYTAEVTR